MAGFQYSYRQCTSHNLQNIYSGNERAPVMLLKEKKVDRLLERRKIFMDMLSSKKKMSVKTKYDNRLNYYDKDLGIDLPKAPAFRETDSDTVYDIVQRLYRPESAHVYRQTPRPTVLMTNRVKSSTSPRCVMTPKEVDMIFSRLHMTQTHCSRVKSARSRQKSIYLKDGRYVVDDHKEDNKATQKA